MLTQTPRVPVLYAQTLQTETQEQPPLPAPSFFDFSNPAVLVGLLVIGEALGFLAHRQMTSNPASAERAKEFEEKSKGMAKTAASILKIAEKVAPPLRATNLDNHVVWILEAYANSNSSFVKETETLHTTPEEVAEFIDEACPELLGVCMNLPAAESSKVMRQVAKEAVAAKASEAFDKESESFKSSKARVEELLLNLRNTKGY